MRPEKVITEQSVRIFLEKIGEIISAFKDQSFEDIPLPGKTFVKAFGGLIGQDKLNVVVGMMLTVDENKAKEFGDSLQRYFKVVLGSEGVTKFYPNTEGKKQV